jgi:hypothetical protein
MPQLAPDPEKYELERLEQRELADREVQERAAEREHEFRIAKLKYSTAGKMRLWQKVLLAFAKAPVWIILAFRAGTHTKADLPEYWQKFLDI